MYSQKDEEAYILREVDRLGLKTGTFLDIGAYDGVQYSNTRALAERGWKGILVEAALAPFQALLKTYGGDQRYVLVHGAAGLEWRLTSFWDCSTTFSTTEPSNRDKFFHAGHSPAFTVATIPIKTFGYADVVSIDTEGTSAKLFCQYLVFHSPKIICVEHDVVNLEMCRKAAHDCGMHEVMANEENIIFAR